MELGGQELASARPEGGSRWNPGKDLSFVPLRPERVVEVRYDYMEGARFRHTAAVRALAPGPRSRLVQATPSWSGRSRFDVADVLAGRLS